MSKVKCAFSSVKVACCIFEVPSTFVCICMLSTYFRSRDVEEFVLGFERRDVRQMASDPLILNNPFSGQLLSV